MNIVFMMNAAFPYGQAFSGRARNLTKLLCSCGNHVHIIARRSLDEEISEELKNVDYSVSYVEAQNSRLALCGIGTARPYMKMLKTYGTTHKIDMILSAGMVFVTDQINRYAKQNRIKYIVEQCEWFDVSTFKAGKFNPYYREHIRLIEKKNRNYDGVIAISRLFEEHYQKQGMEVIRIPAILDMNMISYRSSVEKKGIIHIAFAGSLGKGKENLKPMLEAARRINEKRQKIHVDIYGASEGEVLDNIGCDVGLFEAVKPHITIYGRIPQMKVENEVRKADFSFIIRPKRRSSDAGFPTKLAESMSVGTPVIANDTGDIGCYVKSGENGFLIQEASKEAILKMFKEMIGLSEDDLTRMRIAARETAECSFDYGIYTEAMKQFLRNIRV